MLGMSYVIEPMVSVGFDGLTTSSRCWCTSWGQNRHPSGYTLCITLYALYGSHLRPHFQAFRQAGEAASKRTGSLPQLLIVVLPNGPDVRIQVRYIADIELGVRVQCVVSVQFQLHCYLPSNPQNHHSTKTRSSKIIHLLNTLQMLPWSMSLT